MKYVVFKYRDLLQPVIFADCTSHVQVQIKDAKPISAGFVKLGKFGEPHCYGESESLHLKSRGEDDEKLIRAMLNDFGTASFIDYDNI